MKRFTLTALLLSTLTGCNLNAANSNSAIDTRYRDLQAGYSLSIPAGWQATHGYGDVDLLLQPDADNSGTRISVQWDQRPDKQTVSLEDYAAFRARRLSHFAKKRELITQKTGALNDAVKQALQLEYHYQIGPGHKVQTRSWLMVSPHGQYTLSLTAPPDQFAAMENTWQQVQQDFKLIPQ